MRFTRACAGALAPFILAWLVGCGTAPERVRLADSAQKPASFQFVDARDDAMRKSSEPEAAMALLSDDRLVPPLPERLASDFEGALGERLAGKRVTLRTAEVYLAREQPAAASSSGFTDYMVNMYGAVGWLVMHGMGSIGRPQRIAVYIEGDLDGKPFKVSHHDTFRMDPGEAGVRATIDEALRRAVGAVQAILDERSVPSTTVTE